MQMINSEEIVKVHGMQPGKQVMYSPTNWRNPYMTNYTVVSRRQVELAIWLRAFRRSRNINQSQVARIATVYGETYKVKFVQNEICSYENYKTIPSEKKMRALLDMLDLDLEDLN